MIGPKWTSSRIGLPCAWIEISAGGGFQARFLVESLFSEPRILFFLVSKSSQYDFSVECKPNVYPKALLKTFISSAEIQGEKLSLGFDSGPHDYQSYRARKMVQDTWSKSALERR